MAGKPAVAEFGKLAERVFLPTKQAGCPIENVNEASGRKLHTGDFHSVRFDTAIKRFQGILGRPLNRKEVEYLETIRDLRNRLMHFEVNLTGGWIVPSPCLKRVWAVAIGNGPTSSSPA